NPATATVTNGTRPTKTERAATGSSVSDESETNKTAQGNQTDKNKLETGQHVQLNSSDKVTHKAEQANPRTRKGQQELAAVESLASDEDETPQAYEVLTVAIAQKYFFDRTFGGALIDGARNQFYPLNTLTGFTYAAE